MSPEHWSTTRWQRAVSSPKPDLHDLAARFARKAESDEIEIGKRQLRRHARQTARS